MRTVLLRALAVLATAALAGFYVVAATEHAVRINTSKARGDQSGYMWDAQNVYANWQGQQPQVVIGERNRMPLYAGFLAMFWRPGITNEEYFERAKRWNIYLSVVLLALLVPILFQYLPPLPAANLSLIVAFGYFIFKAGYVQAELLFYFLLFAAFALGLDLFDRRRTGTALWWRAAAAGIIAALAHLTKAAALPFVGIFAAVFTAAALLDRQASRPRRDRLLAIAILLLAFFAVLSPYLRTNKRVFGHYFYNVNTTFYMWYDDWPQASVGTIKHGDGVGWPTLPPDQLPSASRYWREHTVGQIAARIAGGFRDAVERSYLTFWYFKYAILYLGVAAAVLLKRRDVARQLAAQHWPAVAFVLVYAAAYAFGIAFYAPISGTGTTRFLMAHLLPMFFVLLRLLSSAPFREVEWQIGNGRLGLSQVHGVIAAMLAVDIVFVIWPRLMSTYGGF
jgi:hypothetical protein